jgi:ribosomal-protein-alanine N-acetyltransferase
MKIVRLDKETILENIDRLIEIDSTIFDEEGTWTLDNFLMDLDHKWDYSLVVFIGNQIIGFIVCSVKEGNLHIHRLAILLEYQGKKIGNRLLDCICNLCAKHRLKCVTLQVKKFNINAQRFYEQYGFEKIGSNMPNYVYKKVIS